MESYTREQEKVNGLIHVFGILFGLAGVPILANLADLHGNKPGLVGSCIYGFCFLLVFTSSTIYHFSKGQKIKRFFKILDHIGIYFFIAGTYTPFLLVYMPDSFGRTLPAPSSNPILPAGSRSSRRRSIWRWVGSCSLAAGVSSTSCRMR
jgi:hemolysin III